MLKHVCSSTEFVEIGAQDINKPSSPAFAAQAAIHRDRLAVRDPGLLLRRTHPGHGIASETLARGGGGSTPSRSSFHRAYPASPPSSGA